MVNEVRHVADYRRSVDVFLQAAAHGVDEGSKAFSRLVEDLRGNFDLAVQNVGNIAYGRIIGCELEIGAEEKKLYPNVVEAIQAARSSFPQRCSF